MYGLVNKAIQDLVTNKFGEDKWQEIKKLSGFDDDFFVSLQSYPDALTYDLVKNASKVLGADAYVVLETFGEYWILYTADEGYGDMMNLAGDTLEEFLGNLDMLHERLNIVMPHLNPPQFKIKNQTSNSLTLEYRSQREGLSPMVMGLLKGLGKRFKQENFSAVHTLAKGAASDCDVFEINW